MNFARFRLMHCSPMLLLGYLLFLSGSVAAQQVPVPKPVPTPMPTMPVQPMPMPVQPTPMPVQPTPMPVPPMIVPNPGSLQSSPVPESVRGRMAGEAGGSGPIGWIQVDTPLRIDPTHPFKFDIWLSPIKAGTYHSVEVAMEQTDKMSYEPRNLVLRPGKKTTIQARVVKSSSGLAEVIASTGTPEWITLAVTLDAGFRFKLRPLINAGAEGENKLESGRPSSLRLAFIDSNGAESAVDAPFRLIVHSSNASLRFEDSGWRRSLGFDIVRNATSTPLLEVQPDSWSSGSAAIHAEGRIQNDYVIFTSEIPLRVVSPWWLQLFLAVLGGTLYGVYQSYGTNVRTGRFAKISAGAFAGLLSYLLASWNLLGIQMDTTSPRAFVVLGFLFAYVGLDALLLKLKQNLPMHQSALADTQPSGPT